MTDITIENVLVSVADKEHEDFVYLIETLFELNRSVKFHATAKTAEAIKKSGFKVENFLRDYTIMGNLRYELDNKGKIATLGFNNTDIIFDLAIVEPKPFYSGVHKRFIAGEKIGPNELFLDLGGLTLVQYGIEGAKTTVVASSSDYSHFITDLKKCNGRINEKTREYWNDIADDRSVEIRNEARFYRKLVRGDK